MNPKSKIQNPKSRRRSRRAVTIVEVLFAILVATVGVFSVIVIFPFASAQAKRARLNDMFGVAGRGAFHDVDTRGMRIPDQLLAWDHNPSTFGFQSLNELTQLNQPDFNWTTVTPINFQKNEAFCIDPRFIAAWFIPPNGLPAYCRTFPYQEPFVDSNNDGFCQSGEFVATIHDLNGNGVHDPFQSPLTISPNANGQTFDTSLMRRITLRASKTGVTAMSLPQANTIFTVEDDIAYQRDDKDKSKPPTQDSLLVPPPPPGTAPPNPTQWLKRDSERKISWIATLVPQLNVSGVQSDEYTLSVVMIYERTHSPTPGVAPVVGGLAVDKMNERVVSGFCIGDGTSGGEFLLAASDPEQLKVRPNQWVMLSGVLAQYPTVGRFQWYRITECDPEPILNTNTNNYELNVTLVGQDWNPALLAPAPPQGQLLPFYVRVTIVQGAFAVYEKTIRMEPDSSF